MEKLYQRYKADGFEVLAFPTTQFGNQEFRDPKKIADFVENKMKATFTVFSPVRVKGRDTHPLYRDFLYKAYPGAPEWNFGFQYLVSRDGLPRARFAGQWKKTSNMIAKLLKEPANSDLINTAL